MTERTDLGAAEKDYSARAYNGPAPFIFLSYAEEDFDRVLPVLSQLDFRGARIWFSEGVSPGYERDEVIGQRIMDCGYFIAFVSPNYIASLDASDELDFARDCEKTLTLVYLEETELPTGMKMRMTRTQNLRSWQFANETMLVKRLLENDAMKQFYGIADPQLAAEAQEVFDGIERYYPNHCIFGLDGLDKALSARLADVCGRSDFGSVEALLAAYGYRKCSAEEYRAQNGGFTFRPGNEPEAGKKIIRTLMERLAVLYPRKVIGDRIETRDKELYKTISALTAWLGYDSVSDFLRAYGYSYVVEVDASARRSANDYNALINTLLFRYEKRPRPFSMGQLLNENPDCRAALKTLANRSWEFYGSSLTDYFKSIGLIAERERGDVEGSTKLHSFALVKLHEKYRQQFGENADARYEAAAAALDGLRLKVNKDGLIYIHTVDECPERLEVPEGVDLIREGALQEQSGLVSVRLPGSVSSIGRGCFRNCDRLQSVTLEEGVETIEPGAFEGCTALESIELPASLKTVKSTAFLGCTRLSKVVFKNELTGVFPDAFDGCPYSHVTRGEGAADLTKLRYTVDKKNRAKIIGFDGDAERLVIPGVLDGHIVTAVDKAAFAGRQKLAELILPDTVDSIGGDAFSGCANLARLHLPNAVAKLTSSAFTGCTGLREVNIPDAMTEVKRGLFKECPLELLHIGKNLASLDSNAFYKGEADPITNKLIRGKTIARITIDPENKCLKVYETQILTADGRVLLAELGEHTSLAIAEGVEVISAQALERSMNLESVVFPDSLTEIGEKAFAQTALRSVHFGPKLRRIGDQAFCKCEKLTEAELNEGLETIGAQAFDYCPVAEIRLPASLADMGENAFALFSAMFQGRTKQSLSIAPANPVYHEDGTALYKNTAEGKLLVTAFGYSLRKPEGETGPGRVSYTVEEGTTHIAKRAFARCTDLASVTLPEGLLEIGDQAFFDCTALTKCDVPEGVRLGNGVFFGTALAC